LDSALRGETRAIPYLSEFDMISPSYLSSLQCHFLGALAVKLARGIS